jgi:hypothetical protein
MRETDSTNEQERRQDGQRIPARGRRHSPFGPRSSWRTMNKHSHLFHETMHCNKQDTLVTLIQRLATDPSESL